MIDALKISTPAAAGGAGTSTAVADSTALARRLVGVYFKFNSCPATTDVTLTLNGDTPITLLTMTDTNVDVYVPLMVQAKGTTGAAITGVYTDFFIIGTVHVAVAQADVGSTVDVTLFMVDA